MEEYVINFNADVDVKIEANSPEEAKRKAREMFGEYYDKQFAYVYLSDVNFVASRQNHMRMQERK